MQNVLGKRIEMVEYAESADEFVRNIFKPAVISEIQRKNMDSGFDIVLAKKSDLGIAIGKGGSNIEKGRVLMKRFFGMELSEIIPGEEP